MSVADLKPNVPIGFDGPTALPRNKEEGRAWQDANRAWWEAHPMRYDFSEQLAQVQFSKEFYREIDRRFFSDVKTFMPWHSVPFDPLMNFDSLAEKDVLEIGVGNGSQAQLIAPRCRTYTGIDLTSYAIQSTTQRLKEFLSLPQLQHVRLIRMDAEQMELPSAAYDLVWSWGVIHHSANTRRILEEMHRVLRPGGVAITMVYHRNSWNYNIVPRLFRLSRLRRGRMSVHEARQYLIDGAIARYYSIEEWQREVRDLFGSDWVRIFGSKSELLPLPSGKLKETMKSITPDAVGRLFTNRLRLGMFLVSRLRKLT
jgi:ubiquinone/menaquinone biosynthesis C-methylase UbiE